MKDGILDNIDLFIQQITDADINEISKRIDKWSDSNMDILCDKIFALDHVPSADEVRNIINEIEAQIMEKLS